MNCKPDRPAFSRCIDTILALLLLSTPGCFEDPVTMMAPGDEEGEATETTGETDESSTGDESSTDDESSTGDLPLDTGSGETGETAECEWLRFGENLDDDIGGVTTDTWIDEENPTANNGSDEDLQADGTSNSGLTETSLIRFELASLPPGTVTDAAFILSTNDDDTSESSPGSQFSIYLVQEPWVENEATWLQASADSPWSVEGCAAKPCRDEELAFFEPTEQSHAYALALDPALIETWRDDPQANFGLAVATPASNGAFFHSSESDDMTLRPALEVRVCP